MASSSKFFVVALLLVVTFCSNMENGMAARQLLQLPKPTALPPMPTIPSTLPQPTLPPLPSAAGAIPTVPSLPTVSLPPLPSGFPTIPSIPGLTPSGPGN
ncbi:unnamed protein product [Linum tenue]|uniref:Uncharacterized protein n=1 Tax=Linum tenue TaxID=586396 RepID=A0AAV0NNA3_9ROSI|nr:unnamed protein product [Linum tenue]